MIVTPILQFAHSMAEKAINPGDIALDMTMGNGNDTVFLANCVGETGHVYAFDIQDDALHNTKQKIIDSGMARANISLVKDCHSRFDTHIEVADLARVKAVLFNLGYLPGGDHALCTAGDTTVFALEKLLEHLQKSAVIILVCYPGHPEGAVECERVLGFCKNIPTECAKVMRYEVLNSKNPAPFVLAIEKK